jgi:hypothetical protein
MKRIASFALIAFAVAMPAGAEMLNLKCHQTNPDPGLPETAYTVLWIDFDRKTITTEVEMQSQGGLMPSTMTTMAVDITPERFSYNFQEQNPTEIDRQTGTYHWSNTFGLSASGVCERDSIPFPAGKF